MTSIYFRIYNYTDKLCSAVSAIFVSDGRSQISKQSIGIYSILSELSVKISDQRWRFSLEKNIKYKVDFIEIPKEIPYPIGYICYVIANLFLMTFDIRLYIFMSHICYVSI